MIRFSNTQIIPIYNRLHKKRYSSSDYLSNHQNNIIKKVKGNTFYARFFLTSKVSFYILFYIFYLAVVRMVIIRGGGESVNVKPGLLL